MLQDHLSGPSHVVLMLDGLFIIFLMLLDVGASETLGVVATVVVPATVTAIVVVLQYHGVNWIASALS